MESMWYWHGGSGCQLVYWNIYPSIICLSSLPHCSDITSRAWRDSTNHTPLEPLPLDEVSGGGGGWQYIKNQSSKEYNLKIKQLHTLG